MPVTRADSSFFCEIILKLTLDHKHIYAEPLMAGSDTDQRYKGKFIEVEVIVFPLSSCQ